jgi:diamine N-acetyltransferase
MVKKQVDPITDGWVRLRLLEESDLPLTLRWRNQDHIRKWFFNSDVIAPENHRRWFENYCQQDDDFVFIIEETQVLNRPVGQAAIYHVDWEAGCAEFGRLMIGEEDARGKGLARRATQVLVNTALNVWGLHEVYLEVWEDNLAAIAIYRACGFEITEHRENRLFMTVRKGNQ